MINSEVYLEPYQRSTMERFCKDTVVLAIAFFLKHIPS